jgi:hypothetical protein
MYRHIANATIYGERVSGHHYLNESRPSEQFMIDIHWDVMTVHVRELRGTEWVTVSVTPLNTTSPAWDVMS